MYADKKTLYIYSRDVLLSRGKMAKAEGVALSDYDLSQLGAARVVEAEGDVATGKAVIVDGEYVREFRAFSDNETADKEHSWVVAEMKNATIEIQNHEDLGERAKGTLQAWREYRNALRNYTQAGKVVGARPIKPAH
jgi:hypothetical protein